MLAGLSLSCLGRHHKNEIDRGAIGTSVVVVVVNVRLFFPFLLPSSCVG